MLVSAGLGVDSIEESENAGAEKERLSGNLARLASSMASLWEKTATRRWSMVWRKLSVAKKALFCCDSDMGFAVLCRY